MTKTRLLQESSPMAEVRRRHREKVRQNVLENRRLKALRKSADKNGEILDIEFRTRTINAKELGTFLIGLDTALNTAARNFVVQQPNPSDYAEGLSGGFLRIEIAEMRTGSFFSKLKIVWDRTCKHPVGSGLVVAAVLAVFTATASLARGSFPDKKPPRPTTTVEEQILKALSDLSKSDENITVHITYGNNQMDWHHAGKKPVSPKLSRYRDPT